MATLLCTAPTAPSSGSPPRRGHWLTEGWGREFAKVCEGSDPNYKIVESCQVRLSSCPPSAAPSACFPALLSSASPSTAPFKILKGLLHGGITLQLRIKATSSATTLCRNNPCSPQALLHPAFEIRLFFNCLHTISTVPSRRNGALWRRE